MCTYIRIAFSYLDGVAGCRRRSGLAQAALSNDDFFMIIPPTMEGELG